MNTDLEFARKCCGGDMQAWDEFLIRYSRLIYTYIFSAAKSSGRLLTASEKEDIFQDIILSLIEDGFHKLKSYRSLNNCSLASWLRQVTVNFTLSRLSRRPPLSLEQENDAGLSLKELLPDSAGGAPEALSKGEEMDGLIECIERLELDDKYFLELNLNLGLNLEEIKEHLKISRGAVDMRRQRILERLRECFKGKGMIID
jgi:RNA polymerase sigma factor (sigma-70 family)